MAKAYAQDRNAGNTGDQVKVVVAWAAAALATPGERLLIVDSHAGAGCYGAEAAPASPDALRNEHYFAEMRGLRPELVRAALPAGWIGVGPMLTKLKPHARYVGFETSMMALERHQLVLTALGVTERATIRREDGWSGTAKAVHAGSDAPALLFVDPLTFGGKQAELRAIIDAAVARSRATAVAVFNPATVTQNHGRWHDWEAVEGAIAAPPGWDAEVFRLRKSATRRPTPGPRGYAQHYGLVLLASEARVLDDCRRRWKRLQEDPVFAWWSDPDGSRLWPGTRTAKTDRRPSGD